MPPKADIHPRNSDCVTNRGGGELYQLKSMCIMNLKISESLIKFFITYPLEYELTENCHVYLIGILEGGMVSMYRPRFKYICPGLVSRSTTHCFHCSSPNHKRIEYSTQTDKKNGYCRALVILFQNNQREATCTEGQGGSFPHPVLICMLHLRFETGWESNANATPPSAPASNESNPVFCGDDNWGRKRMLHFQQEDRPQILDPALSLVFC